MKQYITTIGSTITEKALEPIKRNLRTIESDMVIENKRLIATVEAEVKQTILNFDQQKKELQDLVEDQLRVMQVKIFRGQSDNELKLHKIQQGLTNHQQILDDQTNNFDQVASAIAMLIENINMQMEAEAADLIDRTNIALYGGY